jgi:hypothetical protein
MQIPGLNSAYRELQQSTFFLVASPSALLGGPECRLSLSQSWKPTFPYRPPSRGPAFPLTMAKPPVPRFKLEETEAVENGGSWEAIAESNQ